MTGGVLLVIAALLGLYMAFNIGANDVANAMGTSVGSRALTFRQAVILAAIFEFAGAFLAGNQVSQTIGTGLLDMGIFAGGGSLAGAGSMAPGAAQYLYGMLSALLAAAIWLQVATHFGLPVSTTHSIVGAVWGFGLIFGGAAAVVWSKVGAVVLSWVISPLAGAVIAFLLFRFIDRRIIASSDPLAATRRLAPIFVFAVCTILVLSLIYKGLKNLHLDLPLPRALAIAVGVGAVAGLVGGRIVLRRLPAETTGSRQEYEAIEVVFRYLQILTACYVAFAHGANDVANAVGPLSSVVEVIRTGIVPSTVSVAPWVLAMGGAGIVLGLALLGYKVIATIGGRITEMTPTRGFSAEFAAATTVLFCSKLGMPISTTHTLVGAVIGVGFARGFAALDLRVCRDIAAAWFITVPAAGILTVAFYGIACAAFL